MLKKDDDHDDVGKTKAASGNQTDENNYQSSILKKKQKKRTKVKYTSMRKAAFHIFKGYVGVGIFLIPMFYRDAGYIVSPLLATAICLMVIDTTLMLLSAKYIIDRPETVMSYPDVTQFVLGTKWRAAVNYMLVPLQLGFCLMYVQTAAGIFSQMMGFEGAYVACVVAQGLVLFPSTLLSRRLSLLAVGSMIATACVFAAIIATTYYIFDELHTAGVAPSTTPIGSVRKYSLLCASQMVVMEGVGTVLPVENSLKPESRKMFPTLLVSLLIAITCAYAIYGTAGYLAFGDRLTESTVSVPPTASIAAAGARLALAFNLLLSYPLQFTPAIQIIDRAFGCDIAKPVHRDMRALGVRAAIGSVIPLVTLLLGPDALELVTAFLGATAASFIGFILPAILRLHLPVAMLQQQQKLLMSSSLSSTATKDVSSSSTGRGGGGVVVAGGGVPITASASVGAAAAAAAECDKRRESQRGYGRNSRSTERGTMMPVIRDGQQSRNPPPQHMDQYDGGGGNTTNVHTTNTIAISSSDAPPPGNGSIMCGTTSNNGGGVCSSSPLAVLEDTGDYRLPSRMHKPCPYHPCWAPWANTQRKTINNNTNDGIKHNGSGDNNHPLQLMTAIKSSNSPSRTPLTHAGDGKRNGEENRSSSNTNGGGNSTSSSIKAYDKDHDRLILTHPSSENQYPATLGTHYPTGFAMPPHG